MTAPRTSETPCLPPYLLARVQAYMADHLRERLTLDQLAALTGYHPLYFRRMYKRTTGQTPSQTLQALRMAHAATLLRTTTLRCLDIAVAVGLSASLLVWHFQRVYGMTPRAYRWTHGTGRWREPTGAAGAQRSQA